MRLEDIDSNVQRIATQTRDVLEKKFLRVRLKRCERGIPISSDWVRNWQDYINSAVRRAVADYLTQNPHLQAQR